LLAQQSLRPANCDLRPALFLGRQTLQVRRAEAAKIAKATATAAATAAGLAVVDPMELLLLALVVAQEPKRQM